MFGSNFKCSVVVCVCADLVEFFVVSFEVRFANDTLSSLLNCIIKCERLDETQLPGYQK